jgi:hypothetical protein
VEVSVKVEVKKTELVMVNKILAVTEDILVRVLVLVFVNVIRVLSKIVAAQVVLVEQRIVSVKQQTQFEHGQSRSQESC